MKLNISTFTLLWIIFFIVTSYGQPRIIVQKDASEDSCGPSSVGNWMIHGTPEMVNVFNNFPGDDDESKMLHLIKEYASQQSSVYKKERPRYQNDTQPTDLRLIVEDILRNHSELKIEVKGESLMRPKTESIPVHLKNTHQKLKVSIDQGVPVIAHFRAYHTYNDRASGEQMWGFNSGHFVVITEIQNELRDGESGFTFKYVDSSGSGSSGHGYIHVAHRDFQAKVWDGALPEPGKGWHRDRPFLLVTAPDIRLGKGRNWWYRQFTIFNYAVYATGNRRQLTYYAWLIPLIIDLTILALSGTVAQKRLAGESIVLPICLIVAASVLTILFDVYLSPAWQTRKG